MDIIKPGTRFSFVEKQKPFLIASAVAVALSVVMIALFGLNYGVDFRGGTEVILAFKQPVNADQVRGATQTIGFVAADVQSFGAASENRYLVRVPSATLLTEANTQELQQSIAKDIAPTKRFSWTEEGGDIIYVRFEKGQLGEEEEKKLSESLAKAPVGAFTVKRNGGDDRAEYVLQLQELQSRLAQQLGEVFSAEVFDPKAGVERVETVGPRVGEQLRNSGLMSVLLALLFILIYIAFRFDIRYAPGAVIALFHDVTITLGVYGALGMEVSMPTIAAILTIVGYSLNDTIIIFDRIRENLIDMKDRPVEEIVDASVNDSLSRTILTSLTTLLSVVALYVFGGGLIKDFAFALLVGIVVGTYSSTFVASPIMIVMHNWLEKRKAAKMTAQVEEERTPEAQV
jgi:preprotein translocase subunit SecF